MRGREGERWERQIGPNADSSLPNIEAFQRRIWETTMVERSFVTCFFAFASYFQGKQKRTESENDGDIRIVRGRRKDRDSNGIRITTVQLIRLLYVRHALLSVPLPPLPER